MMATAFIAFYLKMASNTNLIYPDSTVLPNITVANFNLSYFNPETVDINELLEDLDVDLISFQEYTHKPSCTVYVKMGDHLSINTNAIRRPDQTSHNIRASRFILFSREMVIRGL